MCRMLKEHFSCANERISGTCIDPPKETFHVGGACTCSTPKHEDPPMHARRAENTKDTVPTAGTHRVSDNIHFPPSNADFTSGVK